MIHASVYNTKNKKKAHTQKNQLSDVLSRNFTRSSSNVSPKKHKKYFILYFHAFLNMLYFHEVTKFQNILRNMTLLDSNFKRFWGKILRGYYHVKVIFFGNRVMNVQISVKIGNKTIEKDYKHTFLGITFCHKISWKPHIIKMKTKVANILALIDKSKHMIDNKALYTCLSSLI